MSLEVKVPAAGESITSANVARWHKQEGESVRKGEALVTLETDKVSTELEAAADGTLHIIVGEGEEVAIGTVIASIEEGAAAPASAPASAPGAPSPAAATPAPAASGQVVDVKVPAAGESITSANVARWHKGDGSAVAKGEVLLTLETDKVSTELEAEASGTLKILIPEGNEVAIGTVVARITVGDAPAASAAAPAPAPVAATPAPAPAKQAPAPAPAAPAEAAKPKPIDESEAEPVDVVQALKDVPQVNGMIDGNDVVENHFYDIGVAIGTEKGLIVPVIRDADKKGFAEIEQDILDYAKKSKEGKIAIEDLQGGVFTISNGGTYGSLLSTPILNPPQSGILGMHAIQQRPMAVNGQVVIRPMMYLALSYDHRMVDGKEAVTFLIRIKDCIENPTRLMLEM